MAAKKPTKPKALAARKKASKTKVARAPKKTTVARKPAAKKSTKQTAAAKGTRRVTAFDVDAQLERLERWCQAQAACEVRLLRHPPLSEEAIDRIPSLLTSFPFPLATPYDPSRLVLPRGYRELLRRAGGLRVEYREDPEADWTAWPVVTIYRPADCARAHCGASDTLADSWTVLGTSVEDRAFSTTELISFADAGFATEASRWCFYTGGEPGTAPSIYIEDNDFECLLGKYVDTGEWISELSDPVFMSFEDWLAALVEVVCSRPFDPEENDSTVNAIVERGGKGS